MRTSPRSRTIITLAGAVLALQWSLTAQAPVTAKRPLTYDIVDSWKSIQGTRLSDDGQWLAYATSAQGEDGELVVRNVRSGQEFKHARGTSPAFTPDGKFLAYTGARNGVFNIYTISVDGGEETQLTDTPGLDDGPEYAPDGNFIYFNSSRSGTMQIWRMRPDGSAQEQLTSDEYNNWFPHLSPDGQLLVFLSYFKEVDPQAHPPYKHVYLRSMPADGGAPKVVAYVYGGQGTINVPSWSPDSKRIAFVSNTAMD